MSAGEHLSGPQFQVGAFHPWGHPDPGVQDILPGAHEFIAKDQGTISRHVTISKVEKNPRHDPTVDPDVHFDRRVPTHLVHALYNDHDVGPVHSVYGVSTKHAYIRHLDTTPHWSDARRDN